MSTVPVCGGARLKNICSMGGPNTIIISNSNGAKRTLKVSVCIHSEELTKFFHSSDTLLFLNYSFNLRLVWTVSVQMMHLFFFFFLSVCLSLAIRVLSTATYRKWKKRAKLCNTVFFCSSDSKDFFMD